MRLARTLSCLAIAAMQITPVIAAPAPAAPPSARPTASKNVSSRRQAAERGLAFDNTVEVVEADNGRQGTMNEVVIRKVETNDIVTVPKPQQKSTVAIFTPEPSEVQDEDVAQFEPELGPELANDGPLTPQAPTIVPWPKQTPVSANGAISEVDPDTGTADVRFMGRHRLRVGMKLHVFHRNSVTNARVGDVEVVVVGPKTVIVRPLDGVKLAKLSPGDEVTMDSRPIREMQPGTPPTLVPAGPESDDATRLSSRPHGAR